MVKHNSLLTLICGLICLTSTVGGEPAEEQPPKADLDYSRDIRPILSDHCFACHGPDEQKREADLRLDQTDGVQALINPGRADESELIRRIESDDEDEVMPPADYSKPLTPEEKQLLRHWIDEGGAVRGHWAYEAPQKAPIPGAANPIDHFIGQKIEEAGLQPNGIAEDHVLLRRICLATTGLPPSREQIEDLRNGGLDEERLIDELLATPEFGQHFGRHWLDLVRYADTHGLHLDNYREMWPYRDWVIDALNENLPFDRFITEQLAGDLIPNATLQQKIASGFNRLNVTTSEGGSIYEEVFARNVIDRTDSFGTIFLGLTTQCAVCHEHKFDPISQKDYYSLSAFFNSLDGRALDGNAKDHPPVVRVPSDAQKHQLVDFDRQIAEIKAEMNGDIAAVDQAQREWELSLVKKQADPKLARSESLMPTRATDNGGNQLTIDDEGTVFSPNPAPDKDTITIEFSIPEKLVGHQWKTIVLDVVPDPKTDRVGVSANGNAVLTEFTVEYQIGDDEWKVLTVSNALADVEQSDGDFKIANAFDGVRDGVGWAVAGHQSTGPRQAQFAINSLAKALGEAPVNLRLTLDFQSVYAKHQFYAMHVSLSDVSPRVTGQDLIALGEMHAVGPFPVESQNPGYSRSFASEQRAFKSDETFKYQDQSFTWQSHPDWTPVGVHTLPVGGDAVAVNVLHQRLTSPKKQSVDLLLGTSDGHVVYLNNKRIVIAKDFGPINPLSKTYKLSLRKGDNDVYIKTVSQSRPSQFAYAYRSPSIAAPSMIADLVSQTSDKLRPQDRQSIRTYYRQAVCDHPDWTALQDLVRGLEKSKDKLQNQIPTTLIWKELATPREAHILERGQYDRPGKVVSRDVPEFLPPMHDGLPRNRLGLAKWLTSQEHPLTARVAVNRVWQWVFGTGLVASSEDFGSQGEPPSHQALLDWLAVDFREHGWDFKRLVKQMVMSETFRRDASVSQDQLAADPKNRLLARGPRFRLDAEVLRDQALALAGLLNKQFGGPSIKPPQPGGLWYAVGYTRSNTANFKADQELEKRLRRSVYIFWKRTSPPPQMSTFDAPSRESCTARRERTNTPLQALVLMNESQFVKAAKHLAVRSFRECSTVNDEDRLIWLFQTVTAREPSSAEQAELTRLIKGLKSHYQKNQQAAEDLLSIDHVHDAGSKSGEQVTGEPPPSELAAWMLVASTLLNLDEVVNH